MPAMGDCQPVKAGHSRLGCQPDALELNLWPTRHPVNSPSGHQVVFVEVFGSMFEEFSKVLQTRS
jgi:hypothetical protein